MYPRLNFLCIVLAVFLLPLQNVNADIAHTTSTFSNMVVTQDDMNGFAITADILEGGALAGTLTASMIYNGGTNPFNNGDLWGPIANAFRIFGSSTGDFAGEDTATGEWNISVSANAGWNVEGISVYTLGSILGNPNFEQVTSNGNTTLFDGNNLIVNHNDGAILNNGANLDFMEGTHANGLFSEVHSQNWAINAADATELSFDYLVGFDEPINGIGSEALWLDVQLTSAVPEPNSALLLIGLLGFSICRRRRR